MAVEKTTIARPYAKAAFEYALENKAFPQWTALLERAAFISESPLVKPLLGNPHVTAQDLFAIFRDVCGETCGEQGNRFLQQLAENDRLFVLPEVAQLFEQFRAEQEKSIEVDVASFMPLEEQQQQKIREKLKARLQRDIVLNCRVDTSLLGGAIIQAGDLVIDGSVRSTLENMKHQLIE